MSGDLPTPPPSPTPSPSYSSNSVSSSDLVSYLDTLLTHYLVLLDDYTNLRARLSTDFSSSFLSLAHANRNASSTLGAGRRYGPTEFDSRMKASVGIRPSRKTYTGEQILTESNSAEDLSASEKAVETSEVSGKAQGQQQSQPQDNDNLSISSLPVPRPYTSYTATAISHTPATTNPLNWFGLFPPTALRTTQSTFTTSVTSTIPELLTTISQMRSLEDEVWRVRQELGLEGYDVPEECRTELATGVKEEKTEVEAAGAAKEKSAQGAHARKKNAEVTRRPEQTTSVSPSKTQKLVSKSKMAEPRSRILKLD